MQSTNRNFWRETLRQSTAAVTLAAIFALPLAGNAQSMVKTPASQTTAISKTKALTADQKILHVLNRLGYGARPGDVERVRQIGLDKYIEQQLNPTSINDAVAESKLSNLDVLKMSNAQIFTKYPNPIAVLAVVAERNGIERKQLGAELKADKKERKTGAMAEVTDDAMTAPNGVMANQNAAVKMDSKIPAPVNPAGLTDEQRREYQQQVAELYRQNGLKRPQEISQQLNASRILRAVYSERQLQEQMVDFWSNHFNVYAGKAVTRYYIPEYDRDVIRPNALGNFRDLLVATAKSPAMLFYLDNYQSVSPDANKNRGGNGGRMARMMESGNVPPRMRERLRERGMTDEQIEQRSKQMQTVMKNRKERGINENYARELMELHTLGVDGGYTQRDIQEIARAFTGWTILDPRGDRRLFARMNGADDKAVKGLQRLGGVPENTESGTFYFNERQHDNGEKIVLGQKIKADGGINDGLQVIDILLKQPATARFISRKLAIKFVSDHPSDALVNQMADAFQKSNGDIKTTLKAMFTAPDFFASENYRAKIKTPLEVIASSIRVLGANTNANPALQGMLVKMGEPLYGYIAPTGYPDLAENWVNTGALLERLNFGLALAANRIPGTKTDLTKFTGTDPDDKERVMNNFLGVVLNNEVSPATRETLLKQLNQPLPEPKLATSDVDGENAVMETVAMPGAKIPSGKKNGLTAANRLLPASGNAEVVKIVGLILGSPEFQRQ